MQRCGRAFKDEVTQTNQRMRHLYKSFVDFEQAATEHSFDLMNTDLERIIIWRDQSLRSMEHLDKIPTHFLIMKEQMFPSVSTL